MTYRWRQRLKTNASSVSSHFLQIYHCLLHRQLCWCGPSLAHRRTLHMVLQSRRPHNVQGFLRQLQRLSTWCNWFRSVSWHSLLAWLGCASGQAPHCFFHPQRQHQQVLLTCLCQAMLRPGPSPSNTGQFTFVLHFAHFDTTEHFALNAARQHYYSAVIITLCSLLQFPSFDCELLYYNLTNLNYSV